MSCPIDGGSAWSALFLEGGKRIAGELVFCLCVKAGCHPYPYSSPPVAGTLRHGHFSYQALEVTQKPGGWTALWKWVFFCV